MDKGGDEMTEWKGRIRWRAAGLGTAGAVLVLVIGCAGGAGLMANGVVGLEAVRYMAAGILVGAVLLGALASILGGGGWPEALLVGAGMLVVLVGLNAVLCGGKMEGLPATLLAVSGGCGGAMLLMIGKGSGTASRRRGHKNRYSAQRRR